jgi:osmoprotectant transport system permease protein
MKHGCLIVVLLLLAGCAPRAEVTIGSKSFTESVILGEMTTRLVQNAGVRTQHLSQLGGTQILWQALRSGEIDAYPEYTGTLTQEILADRHLQGEEALRQALAELGIRMSQSLGFNDSYALGMKETLAQKLGIHSISDLRNHPELKLGFSNEFIEREDGWPSLRRFYQLPQKKVRGLDHSLAYPSLEAGAIEVTELYTTDAEIRVFKPRIILDDRKFFPSYQAVLLYRTDLETRHPKAVAAMLRLQGKINEPAMIELNARVKMEEVSESRVAADFLKDTFGLQTQVVEETRLQRFIRYSREHLVLVAISLALGILVALPLGILAARHAVLGQIVLSVTGIVQTIPSLALLILMIPPLALLVQAVPALRAAGLSAIGAPPAMAALFLYSLLPMVRNTYTGLHGIPLSLRESAEALGLSAWARLWLIELPLASRPIMAGIKIAAVLCVGNATLGGLIGAGGYGEPIMTGLRRNDNAVMIWEGAIPAALMALAVLGLFELAERALVPRGLKV